MKYSIQIMGCDDATEFVVRLTPEELNGVLIISHESQSQSTYDCKPVIYVRPGADIDWRADGSNL